MTDSLGNVNNVMRIEEPAGAENVGAEAANGATKVDEQQTERPPASRKSESTTSASLETPSAETPGAETGSFASTKAILEDSQADTVATTPLQSEQDGQMKPQPPVIPKPFPARQNPAANIGKDGTEDKEQPRGFMAKLLSCCTPQ